MEPDISEIAERIRTMRELCGFEPGEVADYAGITLEEYHGLENGKSDFPFAYIYKVAENLRIDIVELITGINPHLGECTVVRAGDGVPMKRRAGFEYQHLAANFKNRIAVPLYVEAPYDADTVDRPIELSTHEGQEFDYVLTGSLRLAHDGRTIDLGPGDSVYYDSGKEHGMIATSEGGCTFLAIVLRRGLYR
jgi:mannose-6-phosphate isomerase-like protein (cupin superfamily)